MSFGKILGSIGKAVGGVALGVGSSVLKTATGGMVDMQGAIQGAKNTTPTQVAQGSMVTQPTQLGSPSWLERNVLNPLGTFVNSLNPTVTVKADDNQISQGKNWLLFGGAGLLAIILLSNNSGRRR